MASDVNDQVFNEKQLFNEDVVAEDDDGTGGERPDLPCDLPPQSSATGSVEAGGTGAGRGAGAGAAGAGGAAAGGGARAARRIGGKASAAEGKQPLDSASGAIAATGAAAGTGGAREKRRRRAAERATKIMFWLETKYDVLPQVCSSFENWKEAPSASYDFDLLWCDTAVPADRFMKLKLYQKMNHFVGMSSITRKNNLGRNLLRMRKQFPKDFKFFPDTWILPTDLSDFKQQFNGTKKTFIIKPDNGCQGKGIFLVRDVEKVPVDFSATYVAQRYITKPFLLDGFKFDLRLYVLVVGCDPLRIFIHKRGLVRLASEQYVEPSGKNLQQSMVHLTNYAINKFNPNFEENTNPEDANDGHKRSWEAVQDFLRECGHDVDQLLADIEDLIIKTLITVQPSLSHFYHSCQPDDLENSMCFEILGFDVMLDGKLQPWLLEVNHAPSFATESELDKMVKTEVLNDTFNLLNLNPEARRQKKREARDKMEQRAMGTSKKQTMDERAVMEHQIALDRTAWEDERLGGYKRLYPSEEKERDYFPVHEAAINIWEMLMGGTSRRTIRLIEKPDEEDKQEKTKSEKGGRGGDSAPSKDGGSGGGGGSNPSGGAGGGAGGAGNGASGSGPSIKRTPEELREVMDRLMNGCSARPRANEASRRRGPSKGPGVPAAEASPVACSSEDAADFGALSSAGAAGASGANGEEEHGTAIASAPSSQPTTKPGRPDVQVGDVIKVQTNLGWESVTVRANRTNGKIDIQFKDGEYMRSVLPRILRDATGNAASGPEAEVLAAASNAAAAASGSHGGGGSSHGNSSPSRSARGASSSAASNASGSAGGAGQTTSLPPAARPPVLPPATPGNGASASEWAAEATAGLSAGGVSARPVAGAVDGAMSGGHLLHEAMFESQLSYRRRGRSAGALDNPLTVAPPTPGSVAGLVPGRGGLRAGVGAPVPASAGAGLNQEPSRSQDVRLRQHLQQLISVRPIATRRPGVGVVDGP